MQHVTDGGTGGRCDDADTSWQARDRSLALSGEQTLRSQLLLQPIKLALQSAFASFFEMFDDELVFTPRLVQADPGASQHVEAISRFEAQPGAARLEHGAANLGCRILQGEIQMSRGWPRDIGKLAFDPHGRQGILEQIMRQAVQGRWRQDHALGVVFVVGFTLHGTICQVFSFQLADDVGSTSLPAMIGGGQSWPFSSDWNSGRGNLAQCCESTSGMAACPVRRRAEK